MKLSVGGIISKSFEVIKERFGALVGTWFVYFGIQIVLMIVLFAAVGATFGMGTSLENPGAFGAGMILFIVIFYLAYILLYCAMNASLNAIASPLQRVGIGDALTVGLRSALPLLGVVVLLLIAYMIGAVVLGLIVGVLSVAGSAGSAIGGLIALVLVTYLASRLSIIFPAIAVEGVRNPITAIGRSWSLTRGNVLPIFLATLVYLVIVVVLCVIAFLPVIGSFAALASSASGSSAMAPDVVPAMGSILFMFLGFFVVSVFISISAAAMQSVIHAQLSGSTGEDLSDTFG